MQVQSRASCLAHLSRGYKFEVTQPTRVDQTPWHPSVTLWCDICGGQSGGKYVTTLLPLTWLFYVAVVIQGENNSNGVGKVDLMFNNRQRESWIQIWGRLHESLMRLNHLLYYNTMNGWCHFMAGLLAMPSPSYKWIHTHTRTKLTLFISE